MLHVTNLYTSKLHLLTRSCLPLNNITHLWGHVILLPEARQLHLWAFVPLLLHLYLDAAEPVLLEWTLTAAIKQAEMTWLEFERRKNQCSYPGRLELGRSRAYKSPFFPATKNYVEQLLWIACLKTSQVAEWLHLLNGQLCNSDSSGKSVTSSDCRS